MLQVSDSARHLLEWIRVDRELPDRLVFRLAPDSDNEIDGVGASLEVTEEPPDTDEISERFGTRLYVDAELAERLSDRVLDVERTPEGPELHFWYQDEFNQWDRGRKADDDQRQPPPGAVPGVG